MNANGASLAEAPRPAERLGGKPVYGIDGHRLGQVYDLAVHARTGRIAYALLRFGGLMGLGRQYRAVPFSLLRYATERGGFETDLTPEELRAAPVLDAAALRQWSDAKLRQRLFDYFAPMGAQRYWTLPSL